MRFGSVRILGNHVTRYTIEIDDFELMRVKLDPMDKALFFDVGGDPNATVADRLLVLEMLARRLEEQGLIESKAQVRNAPTDHREGGGGGTVG